MQDVYKRQAEIVFIRKPNAFPDFGHFPGGIEDQSLGMVDPHPVQIPENRLPRHLLKGTVHIIKIAAEFLFQKLTRDRCV